MEIFYLRSDFSFYYWLRRRLMRFYIYFWSLSLSWVRVVMESSLEELV